MWGLGRVGIPKAADEKKTNQMELALWGSQTSFAKTKVPSRRAWACADPPHRSHQSSHQGLRMGLPVSTPCTWRHRCSNTSRNPPPGPTPALSPPHDNSSYCLLHPYWVPLTVYLYLPSFSKPPAFYRRGNWSLKGLNDLTRVTQLFSLCSGGLSHGSDNGFGLTHVCLNQ